MAGIAGPTSRCRVLSSQQRGAPTVPVNSWRPLNTRRRRVVLSTADAAGAFPAGESGSDQSEQNEERSYTPFPRLRESDPYRLLGLTNDAAFDEVVDARNFLYQEYRWHEPSREAIELAYESIIQEQLKQRQKLGFKSTQIGRRGTAVYEGAPPSLGRRISDMFDPTVTFRTLINEGLVYIGLALWCLFSTDQSFPLAGAFAYSVYKFQSKRMKNNPEGPFFGGNPIVGAVLSTVMSLSLGCAVMALATPLLSKVVEGSLRNIGGFVVVMFIGTIGVYLK